MVAIKFFGLLLCTFSIYIESAFVDTLKKCSIKDSECTRSFLQTVIQSIGKTGIPECGIPPTDPYELNNLSVSVLGVFNVTLVHGVVKGAKDCEVNKFIANLEKKKATMELTCDLTIKGKYKAQGTSPIIGNLLGGANIHGDGKAKVVASKIHMTFDYNFFVRKGENGDLFINSKPEQMKFVCDIGKMTFAANNLYLGEAEASNLIVGAMNDNWKVMLETAGKPFLDKARDIIYEQSHKFFEKVPAKHFITDDLSPYV